MPELTSFKCFMRDAKNKTRIISINSKSLDKALAYVNGSRKELSQALGLPLKPKSAVLIEIRGGKM